MRLYERLSTENSRDYALRMLKENIVNLELPPGSLVSETELARKMGLSRTPVREALIELSKVKIVEIVPQRPSKICCINYNLVEESLSLRRLLECSIIGTVCSKVSLVDIARLEENIQLQKLYLDRGSYTQLMLMEQNFHAMIFEIAHKSQTYELIRDFSIHFDRAFRMVQESFKNYIFVEDHCIILNAIRENQPDLARTLMEIHLTRYKVNEASIRRKYPQFF